MQPLKCSTPKSKWHLIFPKSISPQSNNKLMKIKRNGHQLKKLLIDKQILFVSSLGHLWGCIENSVENIYTDVSV